MTDYSQGKIYKITSASRTDLIYIGSTVMMLNRRLDNHKCEITNCASKQLLILSDAKIELMHLFPCNTWEELRMEEQRVMDTFPIVVNKMRAYISDEDTKQQTKKWREGNKEYIAEQRIINRDKMQEYGKQHWIKNKEQIQKRINERITCECGQEMRKGSLSTHIKRKFHKAYLETLL